MASVERVVWLGMAGTGSRLLAAVLYGVGVTVATLSRALGLGRRLGDDPDVGMADLLAPRWHAVAANGDTARTDSADLAGMFEVVAREAGVHVAEAGVRGRGMLDMVWSSARLSHRSLIQQARSSRLETVGGYVSKDLTIPPAAAHDAVRKWGCLD